MLTSVLSLPLGSLALSMSMLRDCLGLDPLGIIGRVGDRSARCCGFVVGSSFADDDLRKLLIEGLSPEQPKRMSLGRGLRVRPLHDHHHYFRDLIELCACYVTGSIRN